MATRKFSEYLDENLELAQAFDVYATEFSLSQKQFQEERDRLTKDITQLREENRVLRTRLTRSGADELDHAQDKADVGHLREQIAQINAQIGELKRATRGTNGDVMAMNKLLRQRTELQVRLDQLLPRPSLAARVLTDVETREYKRVFQAAASAKDIAMRAPGNGEKLKEASKAITALRTLQKQLGLPVVGLRK